MSGFTRVEESKTTTTTTKRGEVEVGGGWISEVRPLDLQHKRWAERQWAKTATTVNKQIFNAAKRLVAKIVHEAKSLPFGSEIAMSTSSRQLFIVCYKLIG